MGNYMGKDANNPLNKVEGNAPDPDIVRSNLLFPNEILEKILTFLSVRDILVAREVCVDWLQHVNNTGVLQDTVKVKISSDDVLNLLTSGASVYSRFYFHKIDLTRQSMNFWDFYNENITHLDFYDCSVIPRRTCEGNLPDFSLGCPNLQHLGLINCDKYFLMGGKFIQLDEILHLGKLKSLNLSRNKNLTDRILFSILNKTDNLESLDLSECINMVFMKAVHNRFYPTGHDTSLLYSDHVLSFHTLCTQFILTSKGKYMKTFNFGLKLNSTGMNLLLSSDETQWECAHLESPELKAVDVKQFITKFASSLIKLSLGKCKLNSGEIYSANLQYLREFSVCDSLSITDLGFLETMPHLLKLSLDGSSGFLLQSDVFSRFHNLTELHLNGIRPVGEITEIQQQFKSCLKLVPNLLSLDVGKCFFVNDDVLQAIIKRLRILKRLNLEYTTVSDVGLVGILKKDCIKGKPRFSLQHQVLVHENANDEIEKDSELVPGRCLTELTDLEHLNLSHCYNIGESTWMSAINCTNLRWLNLSDCNTLSKQGLLCIINSCRNLEDLILMHCSRLIVTDPEVHVAVKENLYRCNGITY